MPNCPGVHSHVYHHALLFSLFSFHILLTVLPYPPAPLSMPSCVLWIHLQIKQIYHSVMEARKGGRLWNALAPRAGKGSEHGASLPRTFPAAPALALSGSGSLSDFMIHAMPQQPPLPIPVLPVPTKPTQASGAPTKQPRNCNNTVPGLTRNPRLPDLINQGKLRPGLAWLTSSAGLQLHWIAPCLPIR